MSKFDASAIWLLVFFSWICVGEAEVAHPLDEWAERGPLPTSRQLTDMAFGDGVYVVTCDDPAGRVLVSEDGDQFVYGELGLPQGLAATRVIFDHGIWLVVADGRVWRKSAWESDWEEGGATEKPVVEVRAANGEFWAWSCGFILGGDSSCWGEGSELYRSEDGEVWLTVGVTPEKLSITGIIYAEDRYVLSQAGGGFTVAGLWGSEDGESWEAVGGEGERFNSVSYGAGRFVAVGNVGRLAYSDDGVSWSRDRLPFIDGFVGGGAAYSNVDEIVFTGGRFLALASAFHRPILAESVDGVAWSRAATLEYEQSDLKIAVVANSNYYLGAHGFLWKAGDSSIDLRRLLPFEPWDWKGTAASQARLVVAGEAGHVAWSDDGIAFNHLVLPDPADVADLVWAAELGLFVAVGGEGEIGRVWRSSDGVEWLASNLPGFSKPASGVAWSGEQFVVCGADGQLIGSDDGVGWGARESGVSHSLDNIEWGGGHFAAAGRGGAVIYSADGEQWVASEIDFTWSDDSNRIYVTYGRGLWAFGRSGSATLTRDFKVTRRSGRWSYATNPVFAFGEFIYTDGRHVLSTGDGLSSPNRYEAVHAIDIPYGIDGFSRGVRFRDRIFYVGSNGLIGASGVWRDFFSEWKETQFSGAELADEGISGDYADPDSDGWSNALEYAFGLDPKERQVFADTRLSTRFRDLAPSFFVGEHAVLFHPWGFQPPGVSVWIETSRDLRAWSEGELYSGVPTVDPDERETFFVSREVPLRTDNPMFFRIRAEVVRP